MVNKKFSKGKGTDQQSLPFEKTVNQKDKPFIKSAAQYKLLMVQNHHVIDKN